MVIKVCTSPAVSERLSCRALEQVRTAQRYTLEVRSEEERLTAQIANLATRYGRYGYRRITALLKIRKAGEWTTREWREYGEGKDSRCQRSS